VGVLNVATAFGTLIGAAAVPLALAVVMTEAVTGAVFTVWATTALPLSRCAVTVSV
jgi:hypothetical protein